MMKDYANSHCSQVPVAESLAVTCSDGEQLPQSNTTPMPDQYYWPDKTTEHSRLSRFGMTCVPLTENLGTELLTWFLGAFPARTYQLQDQAPELRENEADYGQSKPGSFAKYSHDSHTWKTAQRSLLEDLELSLETWPKWGLMRNGECFHAQMSAEFIYENESGLSLPTPCAQDTSSKKIPERVYIGKNRLPKHLSVDGVKSQIPLSQALKIMLTIPTPRSCTAMAAQLTQKTAHAKFNNLETVIVRLTLPTIGANEGKGSGKKRFIGSPDFRGAKMSEGLRTCETDPIYLNPLFAELVMMWPLGWTDLKPLETGRFQEWRQQHGKFSVKTNSLERAA